MSFQEIKEGLSISLNSMQVKGRDTCYGLDVTTTKEITKIRIIVKNLKIEQINREAIDLLFELVYLLKIMNLDNLNDKKHMT
jgi:hypothetical protein